MARCYRSGRATHKWGAIMAHRRARVLRRLRLALGLRLREKRGLKTLLLPSLSMAPQRTFDSQRHATPAFIQMITD
jgi:hypothetical protein